MWCRTVPSTAGKGWGRHWGAFKLLYYHCNTTKIDRVEQPRTVCGAEQCRVLPGRKVQLKVARGGRRLQVLSRRLFMQSCIILEIEGVVADSAVLSLFEFCIFPCLGSQSVTSGGKAWEAQGQGQGRSRLGSETWLPFVSSFCSS